MFQIFVEHADEEKYSACHILKHSLSLSLSLFLSISISVPIGLFCLLYVSHRLSFFFSPFTSQFISHLFLSLYFLAHIFNSLLLFLSKHIFSFSFYRFLHHRLFPVSSLCPLVLPRLSLSFQLLFLSFSAFISVSLLSLCITLPSILTSLVVSLPRCFSFSSVCPSINLLLFHIYTILSLSLSLSFSHVSNVSQYDCVVIDNVISKQSIYLKTSSTQYLS